MSVLQAGNEKQHEADKIVKQPEADKTVKQQGQDKIAPPTELQKTPPRQAKAKKKEGLYNVCWIPIFDKDMQSLKNHTKINDVIVDVSLQLIAQNFPQVYPFPVLCFSKFARGGYRSVQRYTKRVCIFSLK